VTFPTGCKAWDPSDRLEYLLHLNLLSCSDLVLCAQLWAACSTARLSACGTTEIHVCSPCDPDFRVHWCLRTSVPGETSMKGLTPAHSSRLLQHQQWLSLYLLVQKRERLAMGGNTVWGNVSHVEFMGEWNTPCRSPPFMRQRAQSLVHRALGTGVVTIGNSCPSQCLLAWGPCLAAPVCAAETSKSSVTVSRALTSP